MSSSSYRPRRRGRREVTRALPAGQTVFYGVSAIGVGWSAAGILAFCALCLTAVWFIFRTGWRLRS